MRWNKHTGRLSTGWPHLLATAVCYIGPSEKCRHASLRSVQWGAEENGVENASTMRKQELMFAILKQLAIQETDIVGEGVVEVLSDGFGFLRSPDANYLPGPDDVYV